MRVSALHKGLHTKTAGSPQSRRGPGTHEVRNLGTRASVLYKGPHKARKPSERASTTYKDPHTTKMIETPTVTAECAVRRGTCLRLHTAHNVWGGPRVYAPH